MKFQAENKRERLWNLDYIKLMSANFMLFFSFYLLMPLLPIYMSDTFGAGKHEIGAVLCGYSVMALLARPFAGYIVDTFSRRRVLICVYALFSLLFSGYLLVGSLVAFAILRTLHGAPFGMSTVANSTSAIDSLLPSRRSEGIGYYGLSNNVAMAAAPPVALFVFRHTGSFDVLFFMSFCISFVGLLIASSAKSHQPKLTQQASDAQAIAPERRQKISFDRFLLLPALPEAAVLATWSFSFGILSTYIAIYSQQSLGESHDAGIYFLIAASGLVLSRLIGSWSLRRGLIAENIQWGSTLSLLGYTLLTFFGHNVAAYYASAVMIGLGNGHMFPGMQTLFINMAPHTRRGTANATLLTAWDTGIGLGIVVGGTVAEHAGYTAAFATSALVNAVGVALFWLKVRHHYWANKLR